MLSRLFPTQFDNNYRGHWLALWLFVPILLFRVAQSVAVMSDARYVLTHADAIPLDTYSAAGAATVVSFAWLLALLGLVLPLQGVVVLIRYRTMIPFMYLCLLLMDLGKRLVLLVNPIEEIRCGIRRAPRQPRTVRVHAHRLRPVAAAQTRRATTISSMNAPVPGSVHFGQRKVVGAILGALAGMVLGVLTVVTGFYALDDTPAYGWDLRPFLVLPLAAIAALLLAGAGAHTGIRMAARRAPAWRLLVPVAAVVVASPFGLYFFLFVVVPRVPARSSPSTKAEIEAWRGLVGTPDPDVGRQLAYEIEDCAEALGLALGADALVMGDCGRFALTRGGRPHPSQRRGGDNGWRWRVDLAPPESRVIVYADELLGGDPPVFEVWQSKLLVTRAHTGAPAYIVETDLSVVQAYRDCLEAGASRARLDGTWNGDWRTLPDVAGRVPECPDMRVTVEALNSAGNQNIDILDSRHETYRTVRIAVPSGSRGRQWIRTARARPPPLPRGSERALARHDQNDDRNRARPAARDLRAAAPGAM